ncbi:hypothetical protein AB0G74_09825 [Streptomyces sp. NPDC020875]|uniref:hypothetical protein n=1 Tax=Streptomyces sp. NPDC020875 TaxID=3154898 RepID=UPI0033FA08CD
MSVWSWFGRKKKAAAEVAGAEPGAGTEAAGGSAGDVSADAAGGDAVSADTGGEKPQNPEKAAEAAKAENPEKAEKAAGCPVTAAESPVGAGVGIPRQQSTGDVEGSEAGEGARQ